MEDLVALISKFYVIEVREREFLHKPTHGTQDRFCLELIMSRGLGFEGCKIIFGPAQRVGPGGGLYQEVPYIFGETYGQYSNKIEYEIRGAGELLEVRGPLLKREKYPAVFQVVESMHVVLTESASLHGREEERNIIYAKLLN